MKEMFLYIAIVFLIVLIGKLFFENIFLLISLLLLLFSLFCFVIAAKQEIKKGMGA